MQPELKNIFVSLEVAKLAKEKGFDEWCYAFIQPPKIKGFENEVSCFPNIHDSLIGFDFEEYGNEKFYGVPTHHQLIEWLLESHEILISKNFSNYTVYNPAPDSNLTDINEALLYALTLIK